MIHGVLDRIENGIATILIDDLNEELILSASELPEGSEEGTWFYLEKVNDSFVINKIDHTRVASERQRSKNIMKQLQSRNKTSKFKRR